MQKPSWLVSQVTFGNIMTSCIALFTAGGIYVSVTGTLAKLQENDAKQTAEIERLRVAVAEIPQLGYRVTLAEGQLKAIGERLDNAFSTFSARLDRASEATATGLATINATIAGLDTRVAVLTQRVEIYSQERREEASPPTPPSRTGDRR